LDITGEVQNVLKEMC